MTEVGSSSQWRFERKIAGQKTKDGIRHALRTCVEHFAGGDRIHSFA
jgi:hypothetical protein